MTMTHGTITYKLDAAVTADQFIGLLRDSSLAERRPIDDRRCMEGMIENSNLTVTAWDGGHLVGIARSLTDFHYACYLSDLAVSKNYQNTGVGKRLQIMTQEQLSPRCKVILLAAPGVDSYYTHLGYRRHLGCWVLEREHTIRS